MEQHRHVRNMLPRSLQRGGIRLRLVYWNAWQAPTWSITLSGKSCKPLPLPLLLVCWRLQKYWSGSQGEGENRHLCKGCWQPLIRQKECWHPWPLGAKHRLPLKWVKKRGWTSTEWEEGSSFGFLCMRFLWHLEWQVRHSLRVKTSDIKPVWLNRWHQSRQSRQTPPCHEHNLPPRITKGDLFRLPINAL